MLATYIGDPRLYGVSIVQFDMSILINLHSVAHGMVWSNLTSVSAPEMRQGRALSLELWLNCRALSWYARVILGFYVNRKWITVQSANNQHIPAVSQLKKPALSWPHIASLARLCHSNLRLPLLFKCPMAKLSHRPSVISILWKSRQGGQTWMELEIPGVAVSTTYFDRIDHVY